MATRQLDLKHISTTKETQNKCFLFGPTFKGWEFFTVQKLVPISILTWYSGFKTLKDPSTSLEAPLVWADGTCGAISFVNETNPVNMHRLLS